MSIGDGERPRPPGALTVTERRVADAAVVLAAGEVDIATGAQLHDAVLAALRRPDTARVVLDINEVTFLGSRGLAALLAGLDEAARLDKSFLVALHHQHPVYRVLEVTGVDKELSRHDTVEEALRAG
jgi:anti-anti-sigma factor